MSDEPIPLASCPFCGDAEPSIVGPPDAPVGKVFIGCETCGARGPAWPKPIQAARLWNRRVTQ